MIRKYFLLALVFASPAMALETTPEHFNPANLTAPAWTPDGGAYGYLSGAGGLIFKPRGSGGIPFQPVAGAKSRPSFVPSGNEFTYSGGTDGESDVYTLRFGGLPKKITRNGVSFNPSWSRDESEIVFDATVPPNQASAIYAVGANGGNPTQRTAGNGETNPLWSPDGLQIAFTRGGDIWLMSAGGGNEVQLTSGADDDIAYDWSPNGEYIVLGSNRSGNADLWVVSKNGGTPLQLTYTPSDEGMASWSWDGMEILFSWFGNLFILSDLPNFADPTDAPSARPTVRLAPNQPNPFNPRTTIRFELADRSDVRLRVYDSRGQLVRRLVTGQRVGVVSVVWDGRNDDGIDMPSGTYVYSVQAGTFRDSRKMTLLR